MLSINEVKNYCYERKADLENSFVVLKKGSIVLLELSTGRTPNTQQKSIIVEAFRPLGLFLMSANVISAGFAAYKFSAYPKSMTIVTALSVLGFILGHGLKTLSDQTYIFRTRTEDIK